MMGSIRTSSANNKGFGGLERSTEPRSLKPAGKRSFKNMNWFSAIGWENEASMAQLARQRVDLYAYVYLWDPMRHCSCKDACMLSLAVQKFKELALTRPSARTYSVEIG
jgi:hypothetical protein